MNVHYLWIYVIAVLGFGYWLYVALIKDFAESDRKWAKHLEESKKSEGVK